MKKTTLVTIGLALTAAAPAVAARPPHKPGGNLSGVATPATVTFGSATVIAGKLTGNNNGGQPVTVTEDPFPYGDGYVNPLVVNTNTNGNYSARDVPESNRNYQVRARGEEALTGVRVRMRVSLALSDVTPARGQAVRFRGSVAPKHDGRTVLIQRRTATGTWPTIRTTTLKAATTGNRSTYSTLITIRSTGRYRARVLSDGDHVTSTSASRFERVH